MKIAQVAPLFERVPPRAYGGTERVISSLTEELLRQGHEVTLFASGDSLTGARLVAPGPDSQRAGMKDHLWLARACVQMDQLAGMASQFDILHFHTDYLHFPLARRLGWPHLTTLHGRLDLPPLAPLFRCFADMPLASISLAQRQPLPRARWVANVPHGLPAPPAEDLRPGGGYFAFVGRVSPEKRLDRAIAIAERCATPLRIAAKVDDADLPYFEQVIRPLLREPMVSFLGEVDEAQKRALLLDARALLFPIDWPEPFGLVMIEALSCGTPVIAFRMGSVPEVLEDGVTGFIVDSVDEAVAAAATVDRLSRLRCRAAFDACFTVERMARNYVAAYTALLEGSAAPETPAW